MPRRANPYAIGAAQDRAVASGNQGVDSPPRATPTWAPGKIPVHVNRTTLKLSSLDTIASSEYSACPAAFSVRQFCRLADGVRNPMTYRCTSAFFGNLQH